MRRLARHWWQMLVTLGLVGVWIYALTGSNVRSAPSDPESSGRVTRFTYDTSGPQSGSRFNDWAALMRAVDAVRGSQPEINFPHNETITAKGMPGSGWNLNGATWHGTGLELAVNEYLHQGRITLGEGVRFTNVPLRWLNEGLFVLSTSSRPVVDVAATRAFYFTSNVTVASRRAPIFRLSLRRGAVQFVLYDGSLLVKPSDVRVDGGDSELIDIAGSPENVTVQSISGQSGIADNTVRGRGRLDLNVNGAASEASGRTQTGLVGKVVVVYHTNAAAVGYDGSASGLPAAQTQDAIDELVRRIAALEAELARLAGSAPR